MDPLATLAAAAMPTGTDPLAGMAAALAPAFGEPADAAPDTTKGLPDMIQREVPDTTEARKNQVNGWVSTVQAARSYWEGKAFKRMRSDMAFCAGHQWPAELGTPGDENFIDPNSQRYIANITLRHVASRTATIYGKNPKVVARRKTRLVSTIWDGTSESLQAAMMTQQATPGEPMSLSLLADAQQTMMDNQQKNKMSQTLELLFEHEVDEQTLPFKVQMKAMVRRALTTGVGYVRLGYQRVMGYAPSVDAQVDDYTLQTATAEQLTSDVAHGDIQENDGEMEQLQQVVASLANQTEVVVREGLTFTYPHSTALIPDVNCQQLRGFVGAGWVAEEFFLTATQIKKIYKIDVSNGATHGSSDGTTPRAYLRSTETMFKPESEIGTRAGTDKTDTYHCVWEIFNREDGQVYVICEGYEDFLVEPSAPDLKLERFFPWFVFPVNETYAEGWVFPPSDVHLMRDMQMELNRARQGLREHRRAALPKTFVRKGVLSESDKAAIQSPTPHMVAELEGLQPNEDIKAVLQPYSGPGIDPALYDPGPAYEDYMRTLGQQEANLGGTSGATATEASIAEGSRVSSVSAVVDDLDEFLGELARSAGQVLLSECSLEKVQKVVGPGAVWPDMSREEVSREIYLEIEAASTGRPNQAQQIQAAQAVFPLLMQIPGLSPEFMAKELLRRMDDKLDITDAMAPGMASIMMQNQAANGPGAGAGGPPTGGNPQDNPNAQGGRGAANAPSTEPPQVNAAPRDANPVGRPPMVPLP